MSARPNIGPRSLPSTPIAIGSSVWIAQTITGGMIEFLPDFNNFAPDIPYPEEFKKYETKYGNRSIISCKYKDDCIVIINPREHCGIIFDTKTREFSAKFLFRSGNWSSCVVIGDYLHIDHGSWYHDYSIVPLAGKTQSTIEFDLGRKDYKQRCHKQAIIKFDDRCQSSVWSKTLIAGFARNRSAQNLPIVIVGLISKFCENNLYRFGGVRNLLDPIDWRLEQVEYLDSFYIGTLKNGNPREPIDWQLAPQYRLPHPMREFGYIHYGHFIVTFGGKIPDRRPSSKGWRVYKREYTDKIYILDLRRDCGWTESPVKCPRKSTYSAALDKSQRIHLNTRYWIDLKEIIPEMF